MITIISGERGIGKTTVILKKLKELKNSERIAYGIITPPLFNEEGIKNGFSALNTATGETWELARTDKMLSGLTYGPFHFSSEGFSRANKTLSQSFKQKRSIIFLDEIGPLELKHKEGYYPSLVLFNKTETTQNVFIVIRPELIEEFIQTYISTQKYRIVRVTVENRDKLKLNM